MKLKILNTREVKELLNALDKQFGFSDKGEYAWLISEKDKVYVINRDLNRINLENLKIDSIGLYIGRYSKGIFRLSLEGSMFIKAKKNVIELNDSERNSWMKGEELIKDLGEKSRFVVLKNKNDILGCGRYKEKKLFNYVPKERRLRVIID